MSFIPRITCRRCGRQFSGIRSRCPYCGTRRVRQSDRVPPPTSAETPGTPAAQRAAADTRWQLVFGAILLAAVILAVIVLVSSNLNNTTTVATATLPAVTLAPPPTSTPTPTPTPTPTVTKVTITSLNSEISDFTIPAVGNQVQLTAVVFPSDITPVVTWTSSDEGVATVDDTGLVTAVGAGNTTITLECYGVTATCIARVRG